MEEIPYTYTTNEEKLPKTILEYFMKLYSIKYKDLDKDILIKKATKHWLRLDLDEKQYLRQKFEECGKKYQGNIVDYLKECTPFLKKKRKFVSQEADSLLTSQIDNTVDVDNAECIDSDKEQTAQIPNEEIYNHSFASPDVSNDSTVVLDGHQDRHASNKIPVPCPPPKNGKDLYLTLHPRLVHVPWDQLTVLQKRRYTSAATKLKKLYIEKYREYLHSLHSEELHNLLVNKIDNL